MERFQYTTTEVQELLGWCQQDDNNFSVFEGTEYFWNFLEAQYYNYEFIVDAFLRNPALNQEGQRALEMGMSCYMMYHAEDSPLHVERLLVAILQSPYKVNLLLPKLGQEPLSGVLALLIQSQGHDANNCWFLDGFLDDFFSHTQGAGDDFFAHPQGVKDCHRFRRFKNLENSTRLAQLLPFVGDTPFSQRIVECIAQHGSTWELDRFLIFPQQDLQQACYRKLQTLRETQHLAEVDYWKYHTPHFWCLLEKEALQKGLETREVSPFSPRDLKHVKKM